VRVSAIVALGNPRAVWIALILAAMLGRASILVLLMGLQPARMDGLAASLSDIPAGSTGLGLLLALFASLVCLPATVALATVLVTLVTCLAVAAMARAQIGGHTGDVLGCGEMTAECVALTALACGLAT
jgi:adenosylcobinamide-GDP ribazoletransferase